MVSVSGLGSILSAEADIVSSVDHPILPKYTPKCVYRARSLSTGYLKVALTREPITLANLASDVQYCVPVRPHISTSELLSCLGIPRERFVGVRGDDGVFNSVARLRAGDAFLSRLRRFFLSVASCARLLDNRDMVVE